MGGSTWGAWRAMLLVKGMKLMWMMSVDIPDYLFPSPMHLMLLLSVVVKRDPQNLVCSWPDPYICSPCDHQDLPYIWFPFTYMVTRRSRFPSQPPSSRLHSHLALNILFWYHLPHSLILWIPFTVLPSSQNQSSEKFPMYSTPSSLSFSNWNLPLLWGQMLSLLHLSYLQTWKWELLIASSTSLFCPFSYNIQA